MDSLYTGEKISKLRRQHDMTQRELAERPHDFQWPPDQDLLFFQTLKLQFALWREKWRRV